MRVRVGGDATSLTNALAIAGTGKPIWLAQGTYTNSTTFTVTNNRALYGGFTNGMATVAERDWTNYPTILDGQGLSTTLVRVAGADVILDGLVIRNVKHQDPEAYGILKPSTSPGLLTLANCRIVDHFAGAVTRLGLGARFDAGSVLMTNCVVANNKPRRVWYGGGVYASGANLDIVDCVFSNNTWVTDKVGNYGAGLAFNNGALRVWRTEFRDNEAGDGGGGGAVWLGNGSSVTAVFSNCVFRGNFVAGSATAGGGAVYLGLGNNVTSTFVNCSFAYNTNGTTSGQGGAIYPGSGTLNLQNCILWTNRVTGIGATGHEIAVANGAALKVSYSLLTGTNTPHVATNSTGVVAWGDGILTGDPLFASARDLHLRTKGGALGSRDGAVGEGSRQQPLPRCGQSGRSGARRTTTERPPYQPWRVRRHMAGVEDHGQRHAVHYPVGTVARGLSS